jgi:hypothetical protein
MLRHSHHTGTSSDRRNRRREAAKRKRLAATTAAVTSSMRTAQPARDCQARARDTRHARGRPRTHGLRSHQRCRAPAGRNADRVDVEALDVAPSRTRHCTLKSKEPASRACQPVKRMKPSVARAARSRPRGMLCAACTRAACSNLTLYESQIARTCRANNRSDRGAFGRGEEKVRAKARSA